MRCNIDDMWEGRITKQIPSGSQGIGSRGAVLALIRARSGVKGEMEAEANGLV